MAAEHDSRRTPTERSFGLSVGVVSLMAGAVSWWRGHASVSATLAIIGLVLISAGLLAPAALRGPNRLWWRLAQVLGWVNARVLLTVMFATVFTPVGVITRWFGRNPLRLSNSRSSWSRYAERRRDPRHYDHMF